MTADRDHYTFFKPPDRRWVRLSFSIEPADEEISLGHGEDRLEPGEAFFGVPYDALVALGLGSITVDLDQRVVIEPHVPRPETPPPAETLFFRKLAGKDVVALDSDVAPEDDLPGGISFSVPSHPLRPGGTVHGIGYDALSALGRGLVSIGEDGVARIEPIPFKGGMAD